MKYTKLFSPPSPDPSPPADGPAVPDDSADHVYVFYDEELVLAVNVALATRRPLLLFGPPGCGKSSLAKSVAQELRRRFCPYVVTARTEPTDLLWTYDGLRRLHDAQSRRLRKEAAYYAPGVLWEAFNPGLASQLLPDGRTAAAPRRAEDVVPAVVLIDEIDKADPDVPNSLLEPLDTLSFRLPFGRMVHASEDESPLVIITSNNERDLPRPFLRRCVTTTVKPPTTEQLLLVARAHFGEGADGLAEGVAAHLKRLRSEGTAEGEGLSETGSHPGLPPGLAAPGACDAAEEPGPARPRALR
jgi:MoxR-like ATPase